MSITSSQFRILGSRLVYSVVVILLAACQTSTAIPSITLVPSPTNVTADITRDHETEMLFSLDEACPPPCWEGLIPGVSTRQEVWEVISSPPLLQWSEDNSFEAEDYLLLKPEGEPNLYSMVILEIRGDSLYSIQGNIDQDILVDDIISKIGFPSLIAPHRPLSECTPCNQRDYPAIESLELVGFTFLLFPEEGVYYKVMLDVRDWGCICPRMQVFKFCYFTPYSSIDMFDQNEFLQQCTLFESSDDYLNPIGAWEGYSGWE